MRKKIFKLIERKKSVGAVISCLVLLGTVHISQNLNNRLNKVSKFTNESGTCFSRVGQTYTAKLIGDGESLYLEPGFMDATEKCFGESMAMLEKEFSSSLTGTIKKYNTLASDSHWFHQKIGNDGDTFFDENDEQKFINNLGTRFENLENKFDEIMVEVSELKISSLGSLSTLSTLVFLLTFLAPILLLWDFATVRSMKIKNTEVEKNARDHLSAGDSVVHAAVGKIIQNALEQNKLTYCSQLFTRFHALTPHLEGKDTAGMARVVNADTAYQLDAQIEEIWTEEEDGVGTEEGSTQVINIFNNVKKSPLADLEVDFGEIRNVGEGLSTEKDLNTANVDKVLSNIIGHMGTKLQASGVMLDVKIDQDLMIYAEDESLEQIFYHLINNSIGTLSGVDSGKKLIMRSKTMGGTAVITIEQVGILFSKSFLRVQSGLVLDDSTMQNMDIVICNELVEQAGGQLKFENKASHDSESGVIKIIFRNAVNKVSRERSVKVINVEKGTKKEILQRMAEV